MDDRKLLELARKAGGIDLTNQIAGGITVWIGTGTPEFLERFAHLVAAEIQDDFEQVCRQRDELLVALKKLSGMKLNMIADGIVDKAIASVKGGV